MSEEAKQDETPERPHRAYTLSIEIGGDTWEDVMSDLRHIVSHLRDHGEKCSSVMGGPSCGHTIGVRIDPEMTHERYFEMLDTYLAEKNATKQQEPS